MRLFVAAVAWLPKLLGLHRTIPQQARASQLPRHAQLRLQTLDPLAPGEGSCRQQDLRTRTGGSNEGQQTTRWMGSSPAWRPFNSIHHSWRVVLFSELPQRPLLHLSTEEKTVVSTEGRGSEDSQQAPELYVRSLH